MIVLTAVFSTGFVGLPFRSRARLRVRYSPSVAPDELLLNHPDPSAPRYVHLAIDGARLLRRSWKGAAKQRHSSRDFADPQAARDALEREVAVRIARRRGMGGLAAGRRRARRRTGPVVPLVSWAGRSHDSLRRARRRVDRITPAAAVGAAAPARARRCRARRGRTAPASAAPPSRRSRSW
jgi:hypothetical protein